MNVNRRGFIGAGAALFAAAGYRSVMGADKDGKVIQGFDEKDAGASDIEK